MVWQIQLTGESRRLLSMTALTQMVPARRTDTR